MLMGRSELSSLVVAGASAADGARTSSVARRRGRGVRDARRFSGDVDGFRVLGADSVLLVIAENASSSKQLECALSSRALPAFLYWASCSFLEGAQGSSRSLIDET
ncbi:MAG: hypothetical protein ACLTQI_07600 [Slackia sp.]